MAAAVRPVRAATPPDAAAIAAADETLHKLLHAVESQLSAARRADASGLHTSTEQRAQLQRALDLDALRQADPATRAEAAHVALKIRSLDVRIQTCGRTVISAIASLAAERPPETYGRHGRLREPR